MALIKCEECGNMISDKAVKCPKCGCPMDSKEYCAECGNWMSASASICPNCGCPKSNGQPQSDTVEQRFVFVGTDYYENTGSSGKSRCTFALLAILFWEVGAHYFYVGKTGAGLLNLVLCLIGWIIVAPPIIILLLSLFVGIKALLMTQEEFEENYVFNDASYPV